MWSKWVYLDGCTHITKLNVIMGSELKDFFVWGHNSKKCPPKVHMYVSKWCDFTFSEYNSEALALVFLNILAIMLLLISTFTV